MDTRRVRISNSIEHTDVSHSTGSTINPSTKTVEIKVTLPDVPSRSQIKEKYSQVPKKKLHTSGALIAIAFVAIGYCLVASPFTKRSFTVDATSNPVGLTRGTPDYPTVLPAGKTIEQLDGWTRVSPPDRNPVYAYVDTIGTISVSVSQQPLPEDFKQDTASKVEKLAQGFRADEKITIGNTSVHIGSSVEGPQSVIFSKNNLLILIKSAQHIDNNMWAEYISSLN